MGLGRRLAGKALARIEEAAARSDAAALEKLTPAEREHHDAWQARTEALLAGTPESALPDARLTGKVLHGPAGEELHGVRKRPKRGDGIQDPDAWEARRRVERAVRDAAREPYLAPTRRPVRITRIATRGGAQTEDVVARLAADGLADRPDLVFGVYRVPDLIAVGRLGGERRGIVEWDVVHAAVDPLPPAAAPALLALGAGEVLVDRAVGAPSPLDEDVALDVLRRAGIGPERTIGIAREIAVERRGGGDTGEQSRILARVRGVHVLVPAADGGALDDAAQGAPWRIPAGPPDGVVVDVLQWDAIAQAVHPVRPKRAPLPSPYPYLPLTPQELLGAYLDVVGLDPADAYAAQVTYDRAFDLMGRTSTTWGVRRTGGGPDLPCADGERRPRLAGGHHVVIAYRDRPEYRAGRERFEAYATTELRAHLRVGVGLRRAVPEPAGRAMRLLDRVADVAAFVSGDDAEDDTEHPRYCWPPVTR